MSTYVPDPIIKKIYNITITNNNGRLVYQTDSKLSCDLNQYLSVLLNNFVESYETKCGVLSYKIKSGYNKYSENKIRFGNEISILNVTIDL